MPKNYAWIEDATPHEEGSHCNVETKTHYDNVDAATAMVQAQEAQERGDEPVWYDKSVKGLGDSDRPQDAIYPDDRFNISMTEKGTDDQPSQHRAGW